MTITKVLEIFFMKTLLSKIALSRQVVTQVGRGRVAGVSIFSKYRVFFITQSLGFEFFIGMYKWWRRWAEVGSVGKTCRAFFSVEQITCIVSAVGRFSVRSGWGCEEGNKKSLGLEEHGGVVQNDEAQVGRGRGRHDRIIGSSLGFCGLCVFFRGRQCCLGEHVWLWVPFNAK